VDLNLDTLKHEIPSYLEANGFAVYRSRPGALEGFPLVLWDIEKHPDYQAFVEVARKTGTAIILFATREFEAADIDELVEQVESLELSRDEQRDYEKRLREFRGYEGVTCSLELAFDYNSRLYVYELQPDWYEDFVNVEEELMSRMGDDDDEDDDDHPLGGYYSRN
jgi:hypothetical protein